MVSSTLIGALSLYVSYRFVCWWHSLMNKLQDEHEQSIKYEAAYVKKEKIILDA